MKKHVQQELFPKRGGKRKNAGRKPNVPGKPRLRHAARPIVKARCPMHVTKRILPGVTRLRRFELCKTLQRAFVNGCLKTLEGDLEFRICQFSIQGNHIHLICEASSNDALSRGVQGWSVRVARGVNGHLGREGSLFDDRYHVEIITSPKQTRHALCYVLQNARRHGERLEAQFHGIDPFSSAWWFDGWKDNDWREGLIPPELRTVAEAQSWLLRVGWRRHGLIGVTEVPPAAQA